MTRSNGSYIGRFAPSPSGPLHFGSLVCAVASYIDAKRNHGKWLVRIEDIDPPREQPGAADDILRCLEAHGLHWDGEVRYQSQRSEAYWEVLNHLQNEGLVYRCNCTRKRLAPLKGYYDGHCRHHPPKLNEEAALRLVVNELPEQYQHIQTNIQFEDKIKGLQKESLNKTSGDFVIHRKDGLFAYQLAVVVDDIDQGITDIVRGDDLLDTTCRQIYLYKLLGKEAPVYSHIPVVLDKFGNKLSKQNHAAPLDSKITDENFQKALKHLSISTQLFKDSTNSSLKLF